MKIRDVYTICRQSDTLFIPMLLRHLYWRLVRRTNIIMSTKVKWYGRGRPDISGRLMVGCDNSILSHSNTLTTIKMYGNFIVNGLVRVQRGCRIEIQNNATLELNNCFINNNCLILCEHNILIGSGTAIGWNTQICDEDYHDVVSVNELDKERLCSSSGGGIEIGKHVLIGNNCFIYKNVKIADGVVVASNSIVKKSLLESNTLYAGVPAKEICKIDNWKN